MIRSTLAVVDIRADYFWFRIDTRLTALSNVSNIYAAVSRVAAI